MTQRIYTRLGRAQKLWPKVARRGPDECWLFTGALTKGYGHIRVNGIHTQAHRVAYELEVGPIPDGLQLDHLCRNRACCNPAHLEPVTCRENLLRGATLNALNAAKSECLRGHPLAGDNLYVTPGRRHCRACRREASRRYVESAQQTLRLVG